MTIDIFEVINNQPVIEWLIVATEFKNSFEKSCFRIGFEETCYRNSVIIIWCWAICVFI